MLAQDSLGYVHEVPDVQYGYGLAEYPDGSVGEVPMALDGYGSPVGLPFLAPFAAALAPLAAKALPMLSNLIPGAAQAVGRLVGGAVPAAMQAVNSAGQLVGGGINAFRQGMAQGGMMPTPWGPRPVGPMPMPYPRPGMPYPQPGMPYGPRPMFRAPAPVGWVTPALPFTGTRPRRLYMRCSVWPGASGMVPAFANQALPPPGMPGSPVPGGGMRRRGRARRRR